MLIRQIVIIAIGKNVKITYNSIRTEHTHTRFHRHGMNDTTRAQRPQVKTKYVPRE